MISNIVHFFIYLSLKFSQKKSQKSNRLTPSGGKSHPLRISVTVTDPEGIQVDKNTFKPKIKSSNKNGGKVRAFLLLPS